MATVTFKAGLNDITINTLSNSGLGLFGSNFGNSVQVGEYNQTTFITDSNGQTQGAQVNNIKYLNTMSGYIGSATSGVQVRCIPNYLSTFNVNFSHSSAVKTQNAKLYIYDRTSINNDASGVLTKAYEVRHANTSQSVSDSSGDSTWSQPNGSSYLPLVASPGQSGTRINGSETTQNTHDWYIALSCSPSEVGSKTFAAYFSCEYL